MTINEITPQMKDLILGYILSSNQKEISSSFEEIAEYADCLPFQVEIILEEFEEIGLVKLITAIGYLEIRIKAKAYTLYRQGGFTIQEALLKAEIEKLCRELDELSKELEPNHLEKANKLASIAGSIFSALSLFKS